jgi:type II secretory pathway pseudopilin PulG
MNSSPNQSASGSFCPSFDRSSLCCPRLCSSLHSARSPQRGYILLSLLLMMALLTIAAAVAAPTLATEIRRDREEELIHREMQYRRAIRRFIKQTGRYPMNLEDLDHGQVKYLRKRYKDPITGKDFRLLHMLDIPRVGAIIPNGSNEQGANPADPADAPGQGSSTSSDATSASETQPQSGQNGAANQTTGGPLKSAFGLSGDVSGGQAPGAQSLNSQSGAAQSQQPLGGGLIIGVASTSAKKTIREFNHKSRYNDWLFFYDPAFDGFPELYGPTPIGVPPAALFGNNASTAQQLNGQPQQSSQPSSTSQSSFGQPQSNQPPFNQQQPVQPPTQQQ